MVQSDASSADAVGLSVLIAKRVVMPMSMMSSPGIDPVEDPPIKPGQPTEPPQESPPGSPRPEVPSPVHDPGEPSRPDELPGDRPDEVPLPNPDINPGQQPPAVMQRQ